MKQLCSANQSALSCRVSAEVTASTSSGAKRVIVLLSKLRLFRVGVLRNTHSTLGMGMLSNTPSVHEVGVLRNTHVAVNSCPLQGMGE